MKTTTWKTTCKCGEDVYYYPQKLILETHKDYDVNMNKRIVSLTCCSSCKKTFDYEFPKQFIKIL